MPEKDPADMQESETQQPTSSISEVRYSLREMMQAVHAERRDSALGRELVDATEIEKMFSNRIRKKKRS